MQITLRKIILIVSVLIILISTTLFVLSWRQFIQTPLSKTNLIFIVPPGSSIKSVSTRLHNLGVLRHPTYFMLLAVLDGSSKHIKAGEYQIDAGSTPKQLLAKLAKGKVVMHHFTIVEGWTLKQVLASLKNNQFFHHSLNESNIAEYSAKLGCPNGNLEGYLYPDTYLFAKGVTDKVIIHKAFAAMQKKLQKAWQLRDANIPYKTPYEVLIVASLIEKETARADERAKISGVILRRIQANMPLQIDAAVIYGLGSGYQGKITRDNLHQDTPFNNYLHRGLPPAPIAMPSFSSIVAALHPKPGSELYYVARGDGSHEFTQSLDEHRKAIHKYRINYLADHEDVYTKWARNISWYTILASPQKTSTKHTVKKLPAKSIKPAKSQSKTSKPTKATKSNKEKKGPTRAKK